MLWMAIWVHPYTVIPVQVGMKCWTIWGNGWPWITLWCHGWGCNTQRPKDCIPHSYYICITSNWTPWYAVDGHIGAPLHCCTCHGRVAYFGQLQLGVRQTFRCFAVMAEAVNQHWVHPTFILYVKCNWTPWPWYAVGGQYWCTQHPYTVIPVQVGMKFWKFGGMADLEWHCSVMVKRLQTPTDCIP